MNLWHFTDEDNTLFLLLSTHELNMNITSPFLTLTAKLQTTDLVSSSYFQIGQYKVLLHRQSKFNMTKEKILQMGHWTALRYPKK